MTIRTLLLGALLLPLAACQAADGEAAATPHFISVPGEAEVQAMPDRATLHLAVEARADAAAAAQQQAQATMQRLQALLDSMQIPGPAIQSSQLTVTPETHWEQGKAIVTAYRAHWPVTVSLDDLDKLGDITDQAIALGVNSLGAPELDVSNRRELYRQALAAAAQDARDNAKTLAAALGGRLGPPLQLEVADSGQPPPMLMRAQESGNAAYRPGRITIQVHLTARFALE